jgi:DNA polymerase I-like protein with 3'-5' exonuclease and polymerase domains/uracil-DNA glycosylase
MNTTDRLIVEQLRAWGTYGGTSAELQRALPLGLEPQARVSECASDGHIYAHATLKRASITSGKRVRVYFPAGFDPISGETPQGATAEGRGDAQAMGAQCDRCPLRDCAGPVFMERHPSSVVVVAEAPDELAVKFQRPLVGPGGMELMRALSHAGLERPAASYAYTIACQPPASELSKVLRKVAQTRKRAMAEYGHPSEVPIERWPLTPMEACRPRLIRELSEANALHVLALGGVAAQATAPELGTAGILSVRGTLVERLAGQGIEAATETDPRFMRLLVEKVLPTVHPRFVLRAQRWRAAFHTDVARAFRWFAGALAWEEPQILYAPTPGVFLNWLGQQRALGRSFLFWDVETEPKDERMGFDPLTDVLRCIGFAALDKLDGRDPLTVGNDNASCVVIPFRRLDGSQHYSDDDQIALHEAVAEVLVNPTWWKIGHNAGYYDRIVAEQHFGVTPAPSLDTILMHKNVEPELPHGLGYVGSVYTDVHAWKAGKLATEARTDQELWHYNGIDCVVTGRVAGPLARAVRERNQRAALDLDTAMQDVCVLFHRNGMPIDQTRRLEHRAKYSGELAHWARECRRILGTLGVDATSIIHEARRYEPDESEAEEAESGIAASDLLAFGLDANEHNPGSYPQVGRILYGLWDLPTPLDMQPKDIYTKTGGRSTGDQVLRTYLTDKRLTRGQRDYCWALRQFRKRQKLLGTYIRPMRFRDDFIKTSSGIRGGLVWPDGRVRADWNAHGTRVGRLSSSHPNVQNWPGSMKDMVCAPQGRVLVGADMDQLHLRIIASRWQVASLLEVFHKGLDPHGVFAENVFGVVYRSAGGYNGYGVKPDSKSEADKMRDVAKRLRYAGAYSAKPPTIHRVLLSAEDRDGHLINPNLKLKQVYAMHDAWMEAEPEWEIAWEREIADWKRLGFQLSPMYGRRCDYLDEKENDVVNGPILMMEGDLMGTITVEFAGALADRFPTALLINQCHDSLTVECDEADGEPVARLMEDVMTRTIPGWEVTFTAEASVGKRWSKV